MITILLPFLALFFIFIGKKSKNPNIWRFFSTIFITLDIFLLVLVAFSYPHSQAEIAKLEQRYNSIMYEIEQSDEFNWSIHNDITNWNEDIAFGRKSEKDFWFDSLRPDVYSRFGLIPYEKNK